MIFLGLRPGGAEMFFKGSPAIPAAAGTAGLPLKNISAPPERGSDLLIRRLPRVSWFKIFKEAKNQF